MARSPLNLGLSFCGLILTTVCARDRGGGSATGRMRSRAHGGAEITVGSMSSSRCIGELMIASHAFKLRSHKESVDFLQSLTSLVATRRIRTIATPRQLG